MTAARTLALLSSSVLAILASDAAPARQEKPAENPDSRLTLSKENAAAEELESLVLGLGLDPHRKDPSAEHPTREDREAYERAGFASWLDAQLRGADDTIAPAPANFRSFLEKRQPTLWRVVGLLERDVPEWDWGRRPDLDALLPFVTLAKMLTAAALVEERASRHVQAGELLDASWTLSRPFFERRDLTFQLIAVAMSRYHAGAVRKLSEPPVQWIDRMTDVGPWLGMLDTIEPDHRAARHDDEEEESRKAYDRAWVAVIDPLRKLSPCEVSKLSYEEIWQPAQAELDRWQEEKRDPGPKRMFAVALPNLTAAIRRAGRLLADRELTAKILEIRQEKAASREGRWPEKFSDPESRVCPGASYEYQTRGASMAIRFKGAIDDGGGSNLVLPLSFEVRAPRPTPTPVKARSTVAPPRRP